MHRTILSGAGFLVLAGCGTPQPAEVSVPFTTVGGLVLVDVDLPNADHALALLDTGANASAIDGRWAATLPVLERSQVVGTTGVVAADTVRLDGLRLGGLELPALRATRRDLSGLLAPPGRVVEMILGTDALAGRAVTIDFTAKRLELARGSATAAAGSVPMRMDNGIPTIEASLAGVDRWLRLDTGASLFDTDDVYVNVPTPLWETIHQRQPQLVPSSSLSGTGADGRPVDLPVVAVPQARIGPLHFERVFLIVQPQAGYFADPDAKGFVGNNYLARLRRVTLDFAGGRLLAESPAAAGNGR